MTYPNYSRQSLETFKLTDLKAIAIKIGVTPKDRRSIESHIEAILDRQPTKVETAAIAKRCLEQVEVIPDSTIAETSEAILDELEITFVDLSIGTDLVVPDGLDAYHGVYNGRVILEVYNYKGGYVCRRNSGEVFDDPYSAIVNGYELYNPGAVLLARVTIDRDREIEVARAEMMPEYA